MQVTIHRALVVWCVLWALRVQLGLQTQGKFGIQFVLDIPTSGNMGGF